MKTRQSSKKSRRPGSSRTAVIIEEIVLSDDSDKDDDNPPKSIPVASGSGTRRGTGEGVDLNTSDPTLISTLVKEHCVFCLTRKTHTIFSIGGTSTSEEIDGYELLSKYFGSRTADCLNDIFDAVVFTNKSLLTAEFPAPLLCEKCVLTVRELSDLHKKLELVQRKILHNIRNVRKIIKENGSFIKTKEEPSDNRLQFENEMLEKCNGKQEVTEVILDVLDKFQGILEEETHDQIEIHLEHLEQINSFSVDAEDELDLGSQASTSHKSTTSSATQTEEVHYDIKIFKLSVESEDEATHPDPTPSSPAHFDDDVMDNDFNNEDDYSPGSPQEIAGSPAGVEDVKPDIPSKSLVDQPLSPPPMDNDISTDPGSPAPVSQVKEKEISRPTSPNSVSSLPTTPLVPAKPPTIVKQTSNGISIVREVNSNSSVISIVKETAGDNPVKSATETQEENLNKNKSESLTGNSAENHNDTSGGSNKMKSSKRNPAAKKRKRPISDDRSDSESEESSSESEDEYSSSDSGSDYSEEDSSDDDNRKRQRKSSKRGNRNGKSKNTSPGKGPIALKSLPFKCGICKQLFKLRSDVYRHIRNIHHREPLREESISCLKCEYECNKISKLRHHMKKAHQIELPPQVNESTLGCETCGFSKVRIRIHGFIDHLREHETTKKSISCEDCLQKFTTKQMYQLHPCPQAGRPPGSASVIIESFDNIRKENEYNCRFCTEEKFYSEKSLQRHFEIAHKHSNAFLCDMCGDDEDGFKSKNSLKSHMIEKHGAIKYKCRICEDGKEEFTSFDDLHAHLTFTHFGGYFGCSDCIRRFSTREELESHKRIHSYSSYEKLYPCDLCSKILKSEKGFKQHMMQRHGGEKVGDDGEPKLDETGQPIVEPQLAQPNPMKAFPFSYRPRKNGGAKPFVCNLCVYDCCTSKLYRRHMQIDHGILVEKKTNTRTYQCDMCEYTSSAVRIKGFVQHLMEHENSSKKFTCEDCFGRFTTKQLYQVHPCPQTGKLPGTARYNDDYKVTLASRNEKKDYPCRFCGTVFSSEKTVQKHCFEEHGENAFFCDLCGPGENVAFSTANAFKSHMMTLHDAVPYKCRMCVPTKVFTKFIEMFSHTNIEHLGCSYECPHCGKKFVEKYRLENHISTHSEAKEHICNVCGSAVKSISSLRRHISMFHSSSPRRKHMCEYCSKEFSERGNLKKHIQSLHKDEIEEEETTPSTPTKRNVGRQQRQTPPSTPVARKRRRK